MRLKALLVTVLAAVALISVPGTASAVPQAATGVVPGEPRDKTGAGGGICRPGAKAGTGLCVRVKRGEAAAQAVRALDSTAKEQRRRSLNQRAARTNRAAPPAQCGWQSDPPKPRSSPDRFTTCNNLFWELYTYQEDDGTVEITGYLNMETLQWNSYARSSLQWKHGVHVNAYHGEGTFENELPFYIDSTCHERPDCKVVAQPPNQEWILEPRTFLEFEYTEADEGAPANGPGGTTDHSLLGVFLSSPGNEYVPRWSFYDNYLWGRCDSVTPRNSAGCVNQNFIPSLELSLDTHGASADMLRWAQQNLPDRWGWKGKGVPLRRLADESQVDQNRRVICNSTFVTDPSLNLALAPYETVDSCDEFAFARTYQSGRMLGLTSGAQCAQVTAVQNGFSNQKANLAADWRHVRPVGTPTGQERCVRGHIPNALNGLVGSAFGNLTTATRLQDRDQFWVSIAE